MVGKVLLGVGQLRNRLGEIPAAQIVGAQVHAWCPCFRVCRLRFFQPGQALFLVAAVRFDLGHADHGDVILRILRQDRLISFSGAREVFLQQVELRQVRQNLTAVRPQLERLFEALPCVRVVLLADICAPLQVVSIGVARILPNQLVRCFQRVVEFPLLKVRPQLLDRRLGGRRGRCIRSDERRDMDAARLAASPAAAVRQPLGWRQDRMRCPHPALRFRHCGLSRVGYRAPSSIARGRAPQQSKTVPAFES